MSNMNVKGYTQEEMGVLLEWISRNEWLVEHVISIKKANAKKLNECDMEIVTDFNPSRPIKVEIKIEEPTFVLKNRNITLDALSAFNWKEEFKDVEKKGFYNYDELLKMIDVQKQGTMFDNTADIILKKVKGTSIIIAYNNMTLTSDAFIKYITNTYQVRVNPKKDYGLNEKWESAFFCVSLSDKELYAAQILSEEDFKKVCNTKILGEESKGKDGKKSPTVYIGNKTNKSYHVSTCKFAPRYQKKIERFNSEEEAKAAGYIPCRDCIL